MNEKKLPEKSKMKDIGIAYEATLPMGIDDLNEFQGDLKELSEESFAKLSNEIITTGFAFAPHVWNNPKDGKYYLVDGHQRIKTIRRLAKESGFRIPKIPVVPVKAKSIQEAKRRVLQAASQYGTIKEKGLVDFMSDMKIDLSGLTAAFKFPDIDLSHFGNVHFPEEKGGLSTSEVNKGDENSEWVNLPKFEGGQGYTRLIFHFKNEKEREAYVKKNKIKVTMIKSNQWIVHIK